MLCRRISNPWRARAACRTIVKRLTACISGYESNTHLTRNLLGLQSLPDRFLSLKNLFKSSSGIVSTAVP